MIGYHYSSPDQAAVVDLVDRFRIVSSSQIKRAIYRRGTECGRRTRHGDHLLKLYNRRQIQRLSERYTFGPGAAQYIYVPAKSNRQEYDRHTIEVTELYVRLVESADKGELTAGGEISFRDELAFDPEPYSHREWGGQVVNSDAYVVYRGRHWALELDRGTEWGAAFTAQLTKYIKAYQASFVEDGEEPLTFPHVLWITHNPKRLAYIRREIEKKRVPGLFRACLFNDFVKVLQG